MIKNNGTGPTSSSPHTAEAGNTPDVIAGYKARARQIGLAIMSTLATLAPGASTTSTLGTVAGGATAGMVLASCDDTTINPGEEVVNEIKYKEYTVIPKPGEIYFTLADGTKIETPGLFAFAIKENLTSGTKDVTLQFDAGKLKSDLGKIFAGIKNQYPGIIDWSIRLQFSKIPKTGAAVEFASTLGFTEKFNVQVTGVGMDQLIDGQILTWIDLVNLAGGTAATPGTVRIEPGEQIQATTKGAIRTPDFTGYTNSTILKFNL